MVPVVLALALVVLSVMCGSFPVRGPILPGIRVGLAPRVLAMIAVASFGLAIARASFGTYVYASMQGRRTWELAILVAWGVVLVFGSWLILRLPAVPTAPEGERRHRGWIPSAVLLACIVGWMVLVLLLDQAVFGIATWLGTAAVLALFFALFTYTLSSAVAVGMSAWPTPPGVFRAVGLRRIPVLTFVVVWIVVVSLLPLDPLAPRCRLRGDRSACVPGGHLGSCFHPMDGAQLPHRRVRTSVRGTANDPSGAAGPRFELGWRRAGRGLDVIRDGQNLRVP